ncbi:hypothetical protein EGW08_000055 [Elysia chlorotica]|uniref:Hexosyltransferase n=1 Tax=Elysia chlorotica TaxID=188477 RepID=A0A433UEI4_ELYCH|nr:hypothetical protein EGW08_000055 [Elysia chlorotica]
MLFKRRKSDFCARLTLPSTVFLSTVLLTVSIYSTLTIVPQRRFSPRSLDAAMYEEAASNLSLANLSRPDSRVSAKSVVNVHATSPDPSESAGRSALSAIIAKFRSRVAFQTRPVVNPHPFDYVHNEPNACAGKTVELMMAVPSRVDSFDLRQTIRETWGQFATDGNKTVMLFFLGSSTNDTIQQKVTEESQKHGDIVQENFTDAYRNLSLKTVALVKWVSLHCPNSTFVLKADDDMYINVPRLMSRLRSQFEKGPLFVIGYLLKEKEPFRTTSHKWYLPVSEYPEKTFPNYVSGTSYAMTTTAAMRLYVESFYVRPLFLEDVYLTGILADKASVPRISESEFFPNKASASGCKFRKLICGHKNSPQEILKIHTELFNSTLKC